MNESLGSFHTKSFETKSRTECLELRAVKSRPLHCAPPEIKCRITGVTSLVHLGCCARSQNDTNRKCLRAAFLSSLSLPPELH